jgi:hypothetical protein
MSLDPDKDMLALPAEAKLGGPKNAVRAALLQRRGMAAMARRRGLLVSVHADARCGTGGRKHHLRMLFPTLAKESYSIGCGENSARPNALSRAWKMRVTAPEHDADRTERLVGYVRGCPHWDGVYFRIWENES